MYLLTAEEMRELDRYYIEEIGIPGIVLMDHAGKAVAKQIEKRFPKPGVAVVLAGTGNNGGDGWVLTRYLVYAGWKVYSWLIGEKKKLSSDARIFYQICSRIGKVFFYQREKNQQLLEHLRSADVVIDAMLGIGSNGRLRTPISEVVTMVNQVSKGFIIAVDLPTGVDANTGEIVSEAIQATETVTFAYPKWGHYLAPGADACGQIHVADIGIQCTTGWKRDCLNHPAIWIDSLKPRSPWSHKGTYGHLLIVGGSEGMLGAVVMAGQAAYRTGTGMVTITVPQSQQTAISAKATQEIVWCWPGEKRFDPDSSSLYEKRASRFSAVVIGPGLGRFTGEERWLERLLKNIRVPLVIDADGLNILADYPHLFQLLHALPVVLTPHPGEMARLLDCKTTEVEFSRLDAVRELAQRTRSAVVLKGRYSLISIPDHPLILNPTGNASLAKAGSGDLLAGMIGAFLAQGLSLDKAVPMAVYLHGKAGEVASLSCSLHSLVNSDILDSIASVMATHFPGN